MIGASEISILLMSLFYLSLIAFILFMAYKFVKASESIARSYEKFIELQKNNIKPE
jgi:hypothetical protein